VDASHLAIVENPETVAKALKAALPLWQLRVPATGWSYPRSSPEPGAGASLGQSLVQSAPHME